MKNFLQNLFMSITIVTLFSCTLNAQLPDGSIAPNWTFTDINGNSHKLYDYLDSGKTVYIDVSAAWCSPCWSYHNTNALKNLYNQYGPSGTDEVMVFFFEAQQNNTIDQINGISNPSNACSSQTASVYYGGCTRGNWATGTPEPIIDLPNNATGNSFMTAYNIGYFPTMYMICPNRTTKELTQPSASAAYAERTNCPPPASQSNDPALLVYKGTEQTCGNVDIEVFLQNNGTSPLTACTITATIGGNQVAQVSWTGNLATYATQTVTVGSTTITTNVTLNISITSADNNAANNTLTQNIQMAKSATIDVNFTLLLDDYCKETTWKLFSSAGTVVKSGGPYNCDNNGGGAEANTTISDSWVLPIDCYKFSIYDSYGDGLNAGAFGGTDGSYTLTSNGVTIESGGGSEQFTEKSTPFAVEEQQVSSYNQEIVYNKFDVYPSPFNESTNINFVLVERNNVSVSILNLLGEVIFTENKGMLTAGKHLILIDGKLLSEGIYYINAIIGNETITKKVAVIR